ncbi:MAG: alkaline phosphatase [Chitinophagaceae bacterium]
MKRRGFIQDTAIALFGGSIFTSLDASSKQSNADGLKKRKEAKNIIFLVSDGMSIGTLVMADLLLQRKEGKRSAWLKLYETGQAKRALMDTASASSLVTDSAAASSSWGCGVRVNNGSLNVDPNGEWHRPIWQKFKAKGKKIGVVTTVPVAHATPAGFCINNNKRGDMDDIALQYLSVDIDVIMGGGRNNFLESTRTDKADLIAKFNARQYDVALDREQMRDLLVSGRSVLGLFDEAALPYALDRMNDPVKNKAVPSLAEMAMKSIDLMKGHPKGFVLQIEAGKVDWAAHANDIGGLLYDQIEFDDAVNAVLNFAAKDGETLVIITTDHGNANPGLFYGGNANKNFDRIQQFKHTNDWMLQAINKSSTPLQVRELFHSEQGLVLKEEDAKSIVQHYQNLDETGVYNPRKLPFKMLSQLQFEHTSVGWGSMDHSADFVELTMVGPGSELLSPFVRNTDLHNLMLKAAGVMEHIS